MSNQNVKDSLVKVGHGIVKVGSKTKDVALESKDKIMEALDVNQNGKIDVEDIIIIGLKTPGVHIDRTKFLEKQFMKIIQNMLFKMQFYTIQHMQVFL